MRRLPLIAALPLLAAGCRVPDIPARPSPQEYAVYNAWIEQASASLPRDVAVVVDSSTLHPQQHELQFERCLPPRMEGVFDASPEATLTATSSNDWLGLGDGRTARLLPHEATLGFTERTELFRLSRVAFTRLGYQGFFWAEHRSCTPAQGPEGCSGASGTLIHARKSNGAWLFEDTLCQTILFPT